MRLNVGDIVKCLSVPMGWETNLKVGDIYEIRVSSDNVYSNGDTIGEAVQLVGGCDGVWYLSKRFEKIDTMPINQRFTRRRLIRLDIGGCDVL